MPAKPGYPVGWVWRMEEPRRHYFGPDQRSLCGAVVMDTPADNDDQDDGHLFNCPDCYARRTGQQAEQQHQ